MNLLSLETEFQRIDREIKALRLRLRMNALQRLIDRLRATLTTRVA